MISLFLLLFIIDQSYGAGWQAGMFGDTFFGSCVGKTFRESYGVGFSASFGGFLLFDDGVGNRKNFSIPGIAMDVALSKNGQTLAIAGTNGIFRGVPGMNFAASQVLPNTTISQHIAPFGDAGFAAVGRFGNINGVAISTDGGTTWTMSDIGLSLPSGFYARYGSFPTSTTWYVTSGTWPFASDAKLNNGRVVRISSRLSVYFDIDGHDNPQTTFLSARHLLGTYPGAIVKTTDGGQTWRTVYNSNGKFYFNQIDCLDDQNCITVGEDAKSAFVFKTTDGGNNWIKIMQLTGPFSLHAVVMINNDEYFVSGGTVSSGIFIHKEIVGNYYRTKDGGITWTKTSFNGYGYDLQFSLGSLTSVIMLRKQSQMIRFSQRFTSAPTIVPSQSPQST